MNPIVRATLSASISAALQQAEAFGGVGHPGLRGRFREILVDRLLRPWLPPYCGIGTGSIIDSDGRTRQLSEDDLVVYDREILPQLLLSERDGLFPVESVLEKIEVKSRLSREELRRALRAAQELHELRMLPPQRSTAPVQVICGLFAYGSDVEGDELARFRDCMDELGIPGAAPPVRIFCVVGKGTWFTAASDQPGFEPGWVLAQPRDDHNEVITFVSALLNTIQTTKNSRGQPFWGPYVTNAGDDVRPA